MRKLIVKLKDQTSSFIDPTQPSGSTLIFGGTEKEVSETDLIKRGVLGGALVVVEVVDEKAKEVAVVEEKEVSKAVESPKKKK